MKSLCFILIYYGCHQFSRKEVMVCAARGRGRGRKGPTPRKDKGPSTSETHKGQKSIESLIIEAAEAYREGTIVGIRKLLKEWEEEVKQGSEMEEEMDNWRTLVPNPGNTYGSIT